VRRIDGSVDVGLDQAVHGDTSESPDEFRVIADLLGPEDHPIAKSVGSAAGVGGPIADFLVALLEGSTGSYMVGFTVLGMLVIAGGNSLAIYDRLGVVEVAQPKMQAA
jgi:hypothetical protein